MRQIENKQKAAIWASAKEYGLDRDTVYDIIRAVSRQEHMTALTYLQAAQVIGKIKGKALERGYERTDQGGSADTIALRRKIYHLTGKLGWNDNNGRIEGFVKRQFGRDAELKELTPLQCNVLIEMLKKYVNRKGG